MPPYAEHLKQALGAVAHVLPLELEPSAFVQDLRQKMRQPVRRNKPCALKSASPFSNAAR
jgi:hypothetical protein